MMKYFLTLLLLLMPVFVQAQLMPTGPQVWHDSTIGKTVRVAGSLMPLNYQMEDSSWDEIVCNWVQVNDTIWKVVRGNHRCYAFSDGRAYYVRPRKGVRHAIGTDTRRLIKFNKTDSSWSTLYTGSVDSVTIDGPKLTYHNVFPGVDKVLYYENDRYSERYTFHQEARDSLAGHGPWANHWLGTATKLDLDSLNLNFHDSLGQFSAGVKGRLIRGWLKCQKADTLVFALSREYLWRELPEDADDTVLAITNVIVRKWVVKLTGKPYLVEMFNPVPTASWAEGDIWHNASFGWGTLEASTFSIEDQIFAGVFSPSSDGTLDSIKFGIQLSNKTKNMKAAVYAWEGPAQDQDRIDTAGNILVPAYTDGWFKWDLEIGASITSGTQYSLTIWSDGGLGTALWYYKAQAGDTIWYDDTPYNGAWPATVLDEFHSYGSVGSVLCYYTEIGPPAAGQVITIQQ